MKCDTKRIQHYTPHLRHVATPPWEIKNLIFCRYSADMDENANGFQQCKIFENRIRCDTGGNFFETQCRTLVHKIDTEKEVSCFYATKTTLNKTRRRKRAFA